MIAPLIYNVCRYGIIFVSFYGFLFILLTTRSVARENSG